MSDVNIEITFEVKPFKKTITMPALRCPEDEEVICKELYEQGMQSLLGQDNLFYANSVVTVSVARNGQPHGGYAFEGNYKLKEESNNE